MNKKFLEFHKVNSELKKVLEGVGARKSCSVFGVTESLKVMLSASFDKPILYITSDIVHARKLQEMFENILGSGIFVFPSVADNLIYKKAVSAESFLLRNKALLGILNHEAKVIIASADALLGVLCPVSKFKEAIVRLEKSKTLDRDELAHRLSMSGYRRVDLVSTPGDYSVRGDIVDVIDAGSLRAYRVDFFDDEIERISDLDPETLKSAGDLDQIFLCPNTMLLEDDFDGVIQNLEQMKNRRFESAEVENDFVQNINEIITRLETGDRSHALEILLPLLYENECSNIFDYMFEAYSNEAIVCFDESKMVYDSIVGNEKEYISRIVELVKNKNTAIKAKDKARGSKRNHSIT